MKMRRFLLVAVCLVTALCVWTGYQLNWIRLRHDALKPPFDLIVGTARSAGNTAPAAPRSLRIFNEEGIEIINVDPRIAAERLTTERTRIQSLFPEAEVRDAPAGILKAIDKIRAEAK